MDTHGRQLTHMDNDTNACRWTRTQTHTHVHTQVQTHHFISKDPVDAVVIEGDHPVQPSDLVVSQVSISDNYTSRGEGGRGGGGREGGGREGGRGRGGREGRVREGGGRVRGEGEGGDR